MVGTGVTVASAEIVSEGFVVGVCIGVTVGVDGGFIEGSDVGVLRGDSVGVIVVGVGEGSPGISANALWAFNRPSPKKTSCPGCPRSSAPVFNSCSTCVFVSEGFFVKKKSCNT